MLFHPRQNTLLTVGVPAIAAKRPRINHDLVANTTHELLLQTAEIKALGRDVGSNGIAPSTLTSVATTADAATGGVGSTAAASGAAASGAVGSDSGSARLDFLEASPYYDTSKVPLNTYKAKEPFVGKINSVKRIVGPKATGEICHVNIDRKVWLVFTVTHSVHYIFLNLSSLWRIILAGCNQL